MKPTCDKCKAFLTQDEILNAIYWSQTIFGDKVTTEGLCERCDK